MSKLVVGSALVVGVVTIALGGWVLGGGRDEPPVRDRAQLEKLMRDANYREALEGYRALLQTDSVDPKPVGSDLEKAVACLDPLNEVIQFDALVEAAVDRHAGNWRLLASAARLYRDVDHGGFVNAGVFERGPHRGVGQPNQALERDRTRALQLLLQAMPLVANEEDRAAAGGFWLQAAQTILFARHGGSPYGGDAAWKLQVLTPLDTLPDVDIMQYGWGTEGVGAPVDAQGNPIFYDNPAGWDAAVSDGERWRWALSQAAEADATLLNQTRRQRADFLLSQFGVQTMTGRMQPFPARADGADAEDPLQAGPYAVETLGEDETIARLASGIKRFSLPEEHNFIKLYQAIAAAPGDSLSEGSLQSLAEIFENRRQYDRALGYWQESLKRYGQQEGFKTARIDQIAGNWGEIQPLFTAQPAGTGGSFLYRFRNGKNVAFEAYQLDVPRLLADIQAYLKSSPRELDWQKISPDQIGYRIVQQNEARYRGPRVANWQLALEPRAGHHDRTIEVTTPLQQAGAFLVVATIDGGQTSRVVLWIDDTVILRKPLDQQSMLYIADARTGQPVPGAAIELFGWRQDWQPNANRTRVLTESAAARTNEQGLALVQVDGQKQWLIMARTADGRFAHLGFTNLWAGGRFVPELDQVRTFSVTDRPVYRPGDSAKFKFWVRRARYDQNDGSEFAGQTLRLEIRNPRNDVVLEQSYRTDAFGGFDGELTLPSQATLGIYQMMVGQPDGVDQAGKPSYRNLGTSTFRVEEYKKPEFEVAVDAPTEPAALGDEVKATIRATYYFGGPVTQGTVHYKVSRTAATERWFPIGPWDWLYGNGYLWLGTDHTWFPGWARWGCPAPTPSWWPTQVGPPEVVADVELPIGPDGAVEVAIDTAVARELFGAEQDQRYTITAEVTDASRRTIVGTGAVLASARPLRVTTWLDRGHYRVGDTIDAQVAAHSADQKPLATTGTLELLKVSYDADGTPSEQSVQKWDLATSDQGRTQQAIKASQPGQYRLLASLKDRAGHDAQGGVLFNILGAGFDGSAFRFNDLELTADRATYAVDDRAQLVINTNRAKSTVLLFLNAVDGTYEPPIVLDVTNKTAVQDIVIEARDMPNVFIEAVTISDGQVHTVVRELAVPPESRVAEVVIEPSQEEYLPGQEATLDLTLKGPDGEPFVGSTVLTVYDKAVEAISGGSNVPDIRKVFWEFRRSHNPSSASNLDRFSPNILKEGETAMQTVGVFGGLAEPEAAGGGFGGIGMRRKFDALSMRDGAVAFAMPAPMAAMAAPAGEAAPMMDAAGPAPAPQAAAPVEPALRTDFADTAYWNAAITTDASGKAQLSFKLPESLTTWKLRAWTMGQGTRVGQAQAEVITTKHVLVRLQAPRFFVQTDEVVLSANVRNTLDEAKSVQVVLELDGPVLEAIDPTEQTLELDAGGEGRVDWRVKVVEEGEAVVRMKALTDVESDAMEMRFPAFVHGMLKTESYAGVVAPDQQEASLTINVPAQRRVPDTRLVVQFSPTLAGAMVEALPYLADYPYGCTEQTLNRFLPTVITQRVLQRMGLDLAAIRQARGRLDPQALGDPEKRRDWQERNRTANPVFDEEEVARMAREGVDRLADMQLSDGGWGWFSGYGEYPSAHTTAVVVRGLLIARENDLALPEGMLDRGLDWLQRYQAEQVNQLRNAQTKTEPYRTQSGELDALVFQVLAEAGKPVEAIQPFLTRDRAQLTPYGKALLGLAFQKLGNQPELDAVLRNLAQFVVQDDTNQTAYLNLPASSAWWFWYGHEIETHAIYLKLLARAEPKGELASRLVKYLLNNRKHGSYWDSTRDTALCVEAMAEFLRESGEDRPQMDVAIAVDGRTRLETTITPQSLFQFPNQVVLEGAALGDGEHKITLKRTGQGRVYFNAYLTVFTLEDPITSAGLEVGVQRRVYRLIRDDRQEQVAGQRGQSVGVRVERYRREPLESGAMLDSGDLVEVELELESKNDYEYLIIEDRKAAGFEPVEVRSGYSGNALRAYVEYRDERVVFFARELARGRVSVSYRLRAEIPGRFSALPATINGMYAPELTANSDEIKLRIQDRPAAASGD